MRVPIHLPSGQGTSYWEANGIAYPPGPDYSVNREYRGDSTTLSTAARAPPRLPPSNTQPDMVPFPPQPQPHLTNMFSQQGGQDPYRHPPGDYMNFSQPAPRQRTAIACNYCRRRKIRCSGFESSHDGRCSNCQRFNQECVFTPVSSQAQAFVPVQAAYPNFRNGVSMPGRGRALYPQNGHTPALYGAHGQPLDPMPAQGQYASEREYRLPSPTGAQLPSPTGPYNRSYDDPAYEQSFRKRPHTEPHVALLPPPIPGSSSQTGPLPPMQGRRSSADPFTEQPAFAPASPASSSTSYRSSNTLPPTSHPPYYPAQTTAAPRRSPSRVSVSPHGPGLPPPAPPPGPYQFPSTATLHPPLVLPSQQSRTPPPPQSQPNGIPPRPGMSIQNILDQGSSASPQASDPGSIASQSSRSATDNSMLNSLMPRGL